MFIFFAPFKMLPILYRLINTLQALFENFFNNCISSPHAVLTGPASPIRITFGGQLAAVLNIAGKTKAPAIGWGDATFWALMVLVAVTRYLPDTLGCGMGLARLVDEGEFSAPSISPIPLAPFLGGVSGVAIRFHHSWGSALNTPPMTATCDGS